jgi:hypothetical protein
VRLSFAARRRVEPCPPEKRKALEQALRHFGLISSAGAYERGAIIVTSNQGDELKKELKG